MLASKITDIQIYIVIKIDLAKGIQRSKISPKEHNSTLSRVGNFIFFLCKTLGLVETITFSNLFFALSSLENTRQMQYTLHSLNHCTR